MNPERETQAAHCPGRGFHRALARSRAGWFCLALLLFAGCARYAPQPLTRDAVEARLQRPAPDQLRVLAAHIDHPLLPPLPLHPDQDLTPDGAALLAVLLNPGLRAARDGRGLADAQLLTAGLLPDPELDLGLEVPTGAASGKVTAYGLGLSWQASALLSRGARRERAKAAARQVDLGIAWQEWQIAMGAKAAVYRLRLLEDRFDLARQEATRAGQTLARVEQAVAAGTLTDRDFQAARGTEFKTRTETLDLEQKVAQERHKLRWLLGLPADAVLRLDQKVALPPAAPVPPPAALLKDLEQRRLDLLALSQGYTSQEEALRSAILEQFPKIRLGPSFRKDTDGVQTVGFSVAIELPLFDRNRGPIATAKATRQQLFDEYAARLFTARADVAALCEGLGIVGQQVDLARTAAARQQARAQNYAAGLAAGRIEARAAAGAWQDWAAARMNLLRLEGDQLQAQVALELASGFYTLPPPPSAGMTPAPKGP